MKWYLLLCLLLCTSFVSAATITGTVYDYNLQTVTEAVIQINTTPEQTVVIQEGKYSLEVPQGRYLLRVSKTTPQGLHQKTEAEITVDEEGIFTYDHILFEEIEEFEEPNISLEFQESESMNFWYLYIIGGGLILLGASKLSLKKEIEKDELAETVHNILKKEKRITQKDLRKKIPYGEAAVSLAISQLVHEKKVEKVKKGRSNILIYRK